MGYLKESGGSKEKVIMRTHITGWKYLWMWLCTLLTWILAGYTVYLLYTGEKSMDDATKGIITVLIWIGSLIPLIASIAAFLVWRTDAYILTTRCVFDPKGIYTRKNRQIPLDMCSTAEVQDNWVKRFFNFGTVLVFTASSRKPFLIMKDVRGARKFCKLLLEYRVIGRRKEREWDDEKAMEEIDKLQKKNDSLAKERDEARKVVAVEYRIMQARRAAAARAAAQRNGEQAVDEAKKQKEKLW